MLPGRDVADESEALGARGIGQEQATELVPLLVLEEVTDNINSRLGHSCHLFPLALSFPTRAVA